VDLARSFNVTLVGFARGERFNVYAGEERLSGLGEKGEA
jgi:FdhD protein